VASTMCAMLISDFLYRMDGGAPLVMSGARGQPRARAE
jgi:hypothetical protein